MQFGMWDSVFNMLVLILWFRIWTRDGDRNVAFNPYLVPLDRMSGTLLGFLRPAFFGLPSQVLSLIVVGFLLAFRGLAVPDKMMWHISMGFERQAAVSGVWPGIAFSFLSFGVFLFKIWGVAVIYVRGRGVPSERGDAALCYLSRPLTFLAVELRPIVLLVMGILLAGAVDAAGQPAIQPTTPGVLATIDWQSIAPGVLVLKLALIALAGWVQVLNFLSAAMIVLIIGSWIAMFASSQEFVMLCREWTDFLLGPLRNRPLRVGMLDLTPLIFFFLVGIIYTSLLRLLQAGLSALG